MNPQQAGNQGAPSSLPSSLISRPISVLLIDDQPVIGEAIRRMLATEKDIIFHYCQDPTRALKMAKEHLPTVILQDLVMPELNGLALVRFLRSKDAPTRHVPLIVLSSQDEAKTKADAFAFGANDYLVKLPDRIELIARIRYHSKAYINLLERDEAYRAMQGYLEKLEVEREKSESLLLNILPKPIAERLKQGQKTIADSFPAASVLFADIVGFTKLSASLSPQELVGLMNTIFSSFDEIAEEYGLEKIKTIGDAYMMVAGLPTAKEDHAEAIASAALDMHSAIAQINAQTDRVFSIRVGIHSGPVVAGIIGTKKFLYDLWGDTVNIASRMESLSYPGCIHITKDTHDLLGQDYLVEDRGPIQVKGVGLMNTFFLLGKKF